MELFLQNKNDTPPEVHLLSLNRFAFLFLKAPSN